MNCPCQSGKSYALCCGRFISHQAQAENAEQLMRSRYSAYVLQEIDYLQQTWHVDFRPPQLHLNQGIKWLQLQVLSFEAASNSASVEFEARFLVDGKVDAMHEKSAFVREQDAWWYTQGEMLSSSFTPWKPGRNESCPCGSGKKFKRCCAA